MQCEPALHWCRLLPQFASVFSQFELQIDTEEHQFGKYDNPNARDLTTDELLRSKNIDLSDVNSILVGLWIKTCTRALSGLGLAQFSERQIDRQTVRQIQ